jgi:hypothetical protein
METQAILAQIDAEIDRLQQVRAILTGTSGRKYKTAAKSALKKRQLSPEGRARIAEAQKARWAKTRKTAK